MNQEDHFGAMRLNRFACLRQGYRIAPVQEQHRIVCGELLGNCATDPAARAGDEITLHDFAAKLSRAYKHSNAGRLDQSGAKTPHTLKALRAKCSRGHLCFAKLWTAHVSSRRFSNRATTFCGA